MDIHTQLIYSIQNNKPISFLKLGDGEINCMQGHWGSNCDNDNYTEKLKNRLIESCKFLIMYCNNVYLGKWHGGESYTFVERLTPSKPLWADYHTLLFEKTNDLKKVEILKAIKESKRKKIIVCNPLLIKAKILLDASHIVHVGFNNWFNSDFDTVLEQVLSAIGEEDGNHIVITCAGMGSKVLLTELVKKFPNGIYLDYGSGLDQLCTKRDTRNWPFTYDHLVDICGEIIPENWNDPSYDYIYEEAKARLGTHLQH